MALLGGDNYETARDLINRAIDFVRDLSGVAIRRTRVVSQRAMRAMRLRDVTTPAWMAPVITFLEPVRKAIYALRLDGPVAIALTAALQNNRIVRFVSRSLLRRILVSNLIGFVILLTGLLYMSLDSSWVIKAKRDALMVQGEIIAAAIAGDAKITTTDDFTFDAETVPGKEETFVPLRDDGFAAMELSIQPQQVAPILNRLIKPINTRARIYDLSGTLVVDSSMLLRSGQIIGTNAQPIKDTSQPRTKNFWTRLQHWIIDKEVQVYKEIGTANGKYYPEVRSALRGQPEAMLLLNKKGEQIVSMAVPIRRMGRILGVLLLSTQPGDVDDILGKERKWIWPLAGLALLASFVTSMLMARTVAGPMKRLSKTAELVSLDINAHKNLPAYGDRKDEVGQMARAFRSMTSALFDRIEASERFAADVAHELKNPLTAASSTAQAMEYAKTPEQREELVEQIQEELKRLDRLITDVSQASRLNAELARQTADPVALDDLLRKVVMIFEDKAQRRGCSLTLDIPNGTDGSDFIVNGNEGRIAQVITNLVDNALSFSQGKGSVLVRARRVGDIVEVSVDDEGPGIDEDKLKTVFSRFYTYRPTEYSSRGTNSGLGLSISSEIVLAHGGEIWAENRIIADGKNKGERLGARFVVRLPARRETTQRASGAGSGGGEGVDTSGCG